MAICSWWTLKNILIGTVIYSIGIILSQCSLARMMKASILSAKHSHSKCCTSCHEETKLLPCWLCECAAWAAGLKESTLAPTPRVCNPDIRFWPWCYPSTEKKHIRWLILQTRAELNVHVPEGGWDHTSTDQHASASFAFALTRKTSIPNL